MKISSTDPVEQMPDYQNDQLVEYAKEHGFGNLELYMDSDFFGTDFERPSFRRLNAAIRAGHVSTIIIKDASCIGRDYLDVLHWLQEAAQADVEVIAIGNPGFPENAFYLDTVLALALEGGDQE